jgi:hypothetical protein
VRSVVQLYPGPPEISRRSCVVGRWLLANDERPPTNDGFGAVAQLGERLVCNQEATGSIPVSSTNLAVSFQQSAVSQDGSAGGEIIPGFCHAERSDVLRSEALRSSKHPYPKRTARTRDSLLRSQLDAGRQSSTVHLFHTVHGRCLAPNIGLEGSFWLLAAG